MAKMENIYLALTNRLEAMAPVEVLYDNFVEETDPEEGWKIEANFYPNVPKGQGLSAGVMDQGLFVMAVVFPKGVGGVAPLAAVDAIKAIFPKGLVLTSGGFSVKVQSEPYSTAPLVTPTKFRVPVTVEWVS